MGKSRTREGRAGEESEGGREIEREGGEGRRVIDRQWTEEVLKAERDAACGPDENPQTAGKAQQGAPNF